MNYLAKRIGIWYYDKIWAQDLFEDIVRNIPQEAIAQVRNSKMTGEMSIALKDETYIRFVKASDSGRGQCFSESYVQEGMSYELVNCIVYPCTKVGSMSVFVVNKYHDFWHPIKYERYIKSKLEEKE